MSAPGSGIDVELGDRCSATAYRWAQRTFAQRAGGAGEISDFAAPFSVGMRFGNQRLAMTSDGIGTKIEVAERLGTYETLGHDLVAMVVDDLICNGVEPSCLANILDVDHLDESTVDALMRGLHDAATLAKVAVAGGELAELGDRIGGYGSGMHFNWCATAVGLLPEGRDAIDGRRITAGDSVVALECLGFRSNGFSLARRVLTAVFGERWHEAAFDDGTPVGPALLRPSRIFCRAIHAALTAGLSLHGVAHITGGGIPSKLRRVLRPTGLGASLDSLFDPPPAMRFVQSLGSVSARVAYGTWNMGNGMLVVLPESEVEPLVRIAGEFGFPARAAGRIHESPMLVIEARGAELGQVAFGP
ncbi:MAG: phosphoribosylformylglycinamidine cyclo-ligase [Deltaproteobacteria bacterium]|nr:phosphoribosylformylglycinamidine cyclo-ligase [Deltaproteobacteria bacterium]